MKVQCSRLVNPHTGMQERNDAWLTIGKVYDVLSVYFDDQHGLQFRLLGSQAIPALHHIGQFEVVSTSLPPNWIAVVSDGVFELGPKRWLERGFWERFFDNVPDAVKAFEEEATIIASTQ
jgi:hypothetical protein